MKIALIAPPYPLSEAPSPPLGLSYVAGACIAAGAQVRIIDYIVTKYSRKKLTAELESFCPDIVGATSVTLNFPVAASILEAAKSILPGVITMIGGPHASFWSKETLATYKNIDLIFIGEAEKTLMKWLPVARDKKAWKEIPGLAFMKNGNYINTGPGEYISDLDSIPLPARRLLPLSRYKALGFPISMITGRGCPNRCIFCLGRKMVGSRIRRRDPAKVADEIEDILDLGFDRINIADDLFTASRKRAVALCKEIIARGLSFSWSAFARVDTVDPETLEWMKKAGCDSISFGIESGNPEMLDRIKKGITIDQAKRAVRMCKDAGILPHASFMVGLPGETKKTLQDTLRLARELDIAHGYHFLAPFPGTTVREHISDYDLNILTDDWTRYDANSAIVRTSSLSSEEMEEFVKEAYRPMFDEWEEICRRVENKTATPDEEFKVENEKRLELVYKILSEDLVEELGRFPATTGDPVKVLGKRIAGRTGVATDFATRYIRLWNQKGLLSFDNNRKMVEWRWCA